MLQQDGQRKGTHFLLVCPGASLHTIARNVQRYMCDMDLCSTLRLHLRHLQALAFLEVMQSSEGHIRPDTVTYNTVLKACCNAGQLARAMQASKPMHSPSTRLLHH